MLLARDDLCDSPNEHGRAHSGHYGVVRVLGAGTVLLLFGTLAVAVARVAANDWREGRRERDSFLL